MKNSGHKELIVWNKAMDLTTEIYSLTKQFPKEELYNLTSQIRRAAVSIPSNIAEGRKRGTDNEFKYFLSIAFGSGAELETQLELAKRLGFLKPVTANKADNLLEEVMKMLNKMTSL